MSAITTYGFGGNAISIMGWGDVGAAVVYPETPLEPQITESMALEPVITDSDGDPVPAIRSAFDLRPQIQNADEAIYTPRIDTERMRPKITATQGALKPKITSSDSGEKPELISADKIRPAITDTQTEKEPVVDSSENLKPRIIDIDEDE